MIHDTGVFQYSSTSPETMRIAGELMKTGFEFNRIIDQSFYEKTYIQNQVMGRVLAESILLMNGACIIGYLRKKDMEFYGVDGKDLDGIVSQLRLTKGVEVAMFLYETETQTFKVSLRSNGHVDVSRIAVYFGGGGHTRAAGCDLQGSMYDVINNVTERSNVRSVWRKSDDGWSFERQERKGIYFPRCGGKAPRNPAHEENRSHRNSRCRKQRGFFLLFLEKPPDLWIC